MGLSNGQPARRVDGATLAACSQPLGRNFRVVTPHAANGPLLDGDFGVCALRPGLLVQYSDAVDLYDLVTRIEQRPGITIQVFLNGSVAATLGGRSLFPDVRQGLVEGAGPRA